MTYLERLRAVKSEKAPPLRTDETDETPTGVGSVGFVSQRGTPFSEISHPFGRAHANARSAKSAKSGPRTEAEAAQNSQNSHAQGPASKRGSKQNPYGGTIAILEARCPDFVPAHRWQQAVQDGRRFLARWGKQAEAVGWDVKDLFGLAPAPAKPHPSYRRLSRYDGTGLIWLLQGRPVVALTETTAAIQNPTRAITIYRRHNKPALSPVGDSLDDFK